VLGGKNLRLWDEDFVPKRLSLDPDSLEKGMPKFCNDGNSRFSIRTTLDVNNGTFVRIQRKKITLEIMKRLNSFVTQSF
jgi:hypothetical protein